MTVKHNKVKAKDSIEAGLEKIHVKWHAVSANVEVEDDFDSLFQRTEATEDPFSEGNSKPLPKKIKGNKSATENTKFSKGKIFDDQDLSGTDFSYQDLTDASFKNCNLTGADFSYATLKNANFTGADLTGVKLKEADLENAILLGITIDELGLEELQALVEYLATYYPHKLNLLNLNLTLFDLKRIDLSKLNLRGVDFTGCDMTGVNILDLDLSSCIITPEQINQALGRPPTALELQKMFTPKGKKFDWKKFGKQMESLFLDDGFVWGIWDCTKDKGIAIEDMMKFGKKVYRALAGKPDPKLEEIQAGIKRNMSNRVKDRNEEKKKIIEEKKRETLAKVQQPENTIEAPQKKQIKRREISPNMVHKARGRERG
ncbi:MAG: pentapeptide repeat-containing protein [Alphaproteobacteria bacterium]